MRKSILLFGKTIAVFTFFFNLISCENETLEEPLQEQNIQINKYSLKELEGNVTVTTGFKKLDNLKKNILRQTTDENDLYNFSLDTTEVKEIVIDDYASYTFIIDRPFETPDYFENLVLVQGTNDVKAYLIKYTPEIPIKIIDDHDSFYFEGQREIISLDTEALSYSSGGNCLWVYELWCSFKYPHLAGGACIMAGDGRVSLRKVRRCTEEEDTGGGGNLGGDGGPSGTGPSGGSATDGTLSPEEGSVVTTPTPPGLGGNEEEEVECEDGKVKNEMDECVCPDGKVENHENECVDKCETTEADLKKVFPDTDATTLKEIAKHVNKHGKDYGLDTNEKLQHFLAQAGHESSFSPANKDEFEALEENLNYRWAKLGTKGYWEKYFNPVATPTADSTKADPRDYKRNSTSVYVDVQKFANYVYDDANREAAYKMGNTSTGDGYKYRGRGIFQLTGKYNYQQFTTFYQNRYNSTLDFVATPGLLKSNTEIAVISALWFFEKKVLNKLNPAMSSTTSVLEVTEKVNGGENGLTERKTLFTKVKADIKCK